MKSSANIHMLVLHKQLPVIPRKACIISKEGFIYSGMQNNDI